MNPLNRSAITDIDIQLYLAHAMPLRYRILIWFAGLLDANLRERINEQRDANAQFAHQEYPRLMKILGGLNIAPESQSHNVRPQSALWWSGGLSVATALCLVFIFLNGQENSISEKFQFAAKGSSLGLQLFVKNSTAHRIDGFEVSTGPSDTIQLLPVGPEPQYMTILSWDSTAGVVQVAPARGDLAISVSHSALPPAMVSDAASTTLLICITSLKPFTLSEAEARIKNDSLFVGMHGGAFLENERYYQIYNIKNKIAERKPGK